MDIHHPQMNNTSITDQLSLRDFGWKSRFISSLFLLLIMFFWFLLLGGPIETGGDAIGMWNSINNYLFDGVPLSINHHTLRWAMFLPVMFFLSIVDSSNILLYHVFMALLAAGVSLFVYLIVINRKLSLFQGISALLLIIALMIMSVNERIFTQLLPSGFFIFYMLVSVFFIQRALQLKGWGQLICFFIAGTFAFFAYGSKLTALFFVFPLSLYILHLSLSKKAAIQYSYFFLIALFLGIIVETLLISHFYDYQYGRIFFILLESTHAHAWSIGDWFKGGVSYLMPISSAVASESSSAITSGAVVRIQEGRGVATFYEYLLSPSKYFAAYGYYAFIIYFAVILSVYRLYFLNNNLFYKCLMWIIIGFFTLQSYTVVSVSPYIMYPESFLHTRYQEPLMILSMIFLMYNLISFIRSHSIKSFKLVVASMLFLLLSLLFLSDNILFKHRNYGVLTTLSHMKILSEWKKSDGNVGYKVKLVKNDESVNIPKTISQFSRFNIVEDYVYTLTRKDYCNYTEAIYYKDNNYMYALCNGWVDGETILFYSPWNWLFFTPDQLLAVKS